MVQPQNKFTTLNYKTSTKNISHMCDILDAKIKQKKLVVKFIIFSLVKNSDLKIKLTALTTKVELKTEQDNIAK